MTPPNPDRTSVYTARDSAGNILYIGISNQSMTRLAHHSRLSEWWPFVAGLDIEHHPTRTSALDRESSLIAEHTPPFNRDQNEGYEGIRRAYYQSRGLPVPQDPVDRKAGAKATVVATTVAPRVERVVCLADAAYHLNMSKEALAKACAAGNSPVVCARRPRGRSTEWIFSALSIEDYIRDFFSEGAARAAG